MVWVESRGLPPRGRGGGEAAFWEKRRYDIREAGGAFVPLGDGCFRPPQPPGNPEALEGARLRGRPVPLSCANPEGGGELGWD